MVALFSRKQIEDTACQNLAETPFSLEEILVKWRYFIQFMLDFLFLEEHLKDDLQLWINQPRNQNVQPADPEW